MTHKHKDILTHTLDNTYESVYLFLNNVYYHQSTIIVNAALRDKIYGIVPSVFATSAGAQNRCSATVIINYVRPKRHTWE